MPAVSRRTTMCRIRSLVVTLTLTTAALAPFCGCSSDVVVSDRSPPPQKSTPKIEYVLDDVDFSEFTFASSIIRSQMERMAEQTAALAGAQWDHRGWYQVNDCAIYSDRWCSLPKSIDAVRGCLHKNLPADAEVHSIFLEAFGSPPHECMAIQALCLTASWQPGREARVKSIEKSIEKSAASEGGAPRERWGAHVEYYLQQHAFSSQRDNFKFFCWKGVGGTPDSKQIGLDDFRGFRWRKRFGNRGYGINVALQARKTVPNSEIKRWLQSPESFRHEALSRLDSLASLAEKQLATGQLEKHYGYQASHSAREPSPSFAATSLSSRTASASVPAVIAFNSPPPMDFHQGISNEEKKVMLAEVRAEFARRKQLIGDNYEEMHAAMSKAFPLVQFLD